MIVEICSVLLHINIVIFNKGYVSEYNTIKNLLRQSERGYA